MYFKEIRSEAGKSELSVSYTTIYHIFKQEEDSQYDEEIIAYVEVDGYYEKGDIFNQALSTDIFSLDEFVKLKETSYGDIINEELIKFIMMKYHMYHEAEVYDLQSTLLDLSEQLFENAKDYYNIGKGV